MTRFVYPRLPLAFATVRVQQITEARSEGGMPAVQALVGLEHPHSAPVATGGRVADVEQIASVRDSVLQVTQRWMDAGAVPRSDAADFDIALGDALHGALAIVPADAAHDETWSFLTLVVLPDIAVLRFPDLHLDRLTGTQRNVLRRTWMREQVLGDLMRSSQRRLGEDELVGLFERTALARNRALVRCLATRVLGYEGTEARSEWARELYKRVTFLTGPRLLDALTEEELDGLVRSAEKPR